MSKELEKGFVKDSPIPVITVFIWIFGHAVVILKACGAAKIVKPHGACLSTVKKGAVISFLPQGGLGKGLRGVWDRMKGWFQGNF